ncbi:MAG TPA: nicotinate-nucleotide adenylyltransferase [Phycisphaerae bacterium]|nr:nicotinate-nucleotide adenylyltransferase [Phycisphaerae bacterium]HNU45123.1 nicotinate-nucleotide adenylyltransferase [Phycisphaerae bacterium]
MSQRIGLYGGSFDPIHHGHLIIARSVAEHRSLDRVILLPSLLPPHKQTTHLSPPHHRAEMVRLAIAGEPLFELSDYDLTRPGPSYTIDTVAHFRSALGAATDLFWIIGADSLAELPTWHQAVELVDACHIITARRAGDLAPDWDHLRAALGAPVVERLRAGLLDTPVIDISATDVRRRVREGRSIRYLVPAPVGDYIAHHDLYR